jgi:uncharacterized membrane protein YhaH (DUF805 family)
VFRYDDIGNNRAGNNMSYRNIYNSFSGRISRKQFWFAAIPLFIAAFIVLMLSLYAVRETDLWVFRLNKVVVMLIFMYPALALGVKRLHDRGRPGHTVIMLIVPWLLHQITNLVQFTGDPLMMNSLDLIFIVVNLLITLWFIVDIGIRAGEPGPNEYGPEPVVVTAPPPATA